MFSGFLFPTHQNPKAVSKSKKKKNQRINRVRTERSAQTSSTLVLKTEKLRHWEWKKKIYLTHGTKPAQKTNKERNEMNEDNRPTDTQHRSETFTEETTLMVMHHFFSLSLSLRSFFCLKLLCCYRVVYSVFHVRYCFSSSLSHLFASS